jgi:hypothetical protein
MSAKEEAVTTTKKWILSLDTWAVVAALVASLLIRVGVFKHVPW